MTTKSRLNNIFKRKAKHACKVNAPADPDYEHQFEHIQVSQDILKYLEDPTLPVQIKENFITAYNKIASMNATELIRE